MKIGITFNFNNKKIFSNGLGQNTIFLYDMFKNIEGVKSVQLIDVYKRDFKEYQEIGWLNGYDVINWDLKDLNDIDLIIVLGSFPSDKSMSDFKKLSNNKKIVYYVGGNNLAIDQERMIFEKTWASKDKDVPSSNFVTSKNIDEIWMVPQQEYHNLDYLSIVFNCPTRVVPFIWSPKFIKQNAELIETNSDYTPYFDNKIDSIDTWKIGSIEPNINVVKTAYPILFALEEFYNKTNNKDKVSFNIMNSKELMDNPTLISICKSLNIHKDGKLTFDVRYPIAFISSRILDLIVSHQWENPLNYAYLDAVYFGIPLVHNARLCKDIGYYYEDYKLKTAANLIEHAIQNRKTDINYTSRNREIIERYQFDKNSNILTQYRQLIDMLQGDFINSTYNWESNSISFAK